MLDGTSPDTSANADKGAGKDEKVTLTKAEHEALIQERDKYKTNHANLEIKFRERDNEIGTLRSKVKKFEETLLSPLPTAKDFFDEDPVTGDKILNEEKFNKGVKTIVDSQLTGFKEQLAQTQFQTNVIQATALLEKAKVPEDKQSQVLQYMAENTIKPTIANCQLAYQAVQGITPETLEVTIRQKLLKEFEDKGVKLPDSHKTVNMDTKESKEDLANKYGDAVMKAGKSGL